MVKKKKFNDEDDDLSSAMIADEDENFSLEDDTNDMDEYDQQENIYEQNGYSSRKDYLNHLAKEYNVSKQFVYELADTLGEKEDFDELVFQIEDYASAHWEDENNTPLDVYVVIYKQSNDDADLMSDYYKIVTPDSDNIDEIKWQYEDDEDARFFKISSEQWEDLLDNKEEYNKIRENIIPDWMLDCEV